MASERNGQPLLQVRHNFGLKLPNDRQFCLLHPNVEWRGSDRSTADLLSNNRRFRCVKLACKDTKMIFLMNMVKHSNPIEFSLLATVSAVFGYGVLPTGQGSTRNFTVTGFTLAVSMVYSTAPDVPPRVAGIATSAEGARRFVDRLIMQTSTYYNNHLHTPLISPKVRSGIEDPSVHAAAAPCTPLPANPNGPKIARVSDPHLTISGSFSTTNIIMTS
ncbi:hypothetical protein KIN20_027547 [Parelaphostrongylus tenuis]|uniref:Uncharacterized protein n=1 Tax=Parelaphostrongylus tenuis TaxID=148309 RepID=A0AAD5WDW2_PARTN|nr:hypothetical protein KIN20_027547 [Parelaphostrongylus tenuis]